MLIGVICQCQPRSCISNECRLIIKLTEKFSVFRQSVLILGMMECFMAEYSIILAKLGIIVKANSYNSNYKKYNIIPYS